LGTWPREEEGIVKRWLIQLWARLYNYLAPYEWGGILYDYANGELNELYRWEDGAAMMQAWRIIENMSYAGRDAVYVAVIKTGNGAGYFVVHDSDLGWWEVHFNKYYCPIKAYEETMAKCRKTAKRMGFKDPEEKHEG
jgi:hypothetical protein